MEGNSHSSVDTAGIRKKSQVHEDVEYWAFRLEAPQAMDRADVCLRG